jgi:hypothetical protein
MPRWASLLQRARAMRHAFENTVGVLAGGLRPSLDHLVRPLEQRGWGSQAEGSQAWCRFRSNRARELLFLRRLRTRSPTNTKKTPKSRPPTLRPTVARSPVSLILRITAVSAGRTLAPRLEEE